MFHGKVLFLVWYRSPIIVQLPVWGFIDLTSKAVDFIDWNMARSIGPCIQLLFLSAFRNDGEGQMKETRAVITPELFSANNDGAGQPRIDRRSEG